MTAILGFASTLVFLGLFVWSINALSVLRLQMDEVLARLERIEHGPRGERSPQAP